MATSTYPRNISVILALVLLGAIVQTTDVQADQVTIPEEGQTRNYLIDKAGRISPSDEMSIKQIAAGLLQDHPVLTYLSIAPVILIIVAGFVLGSAGATNSPIFRLPVITNKETRQEVGRVQAGGMHRIRDRKTETGSDILMSGDLLYRHFPIKPDDIDEISDDLHVKD